MKRLSALLPEGVRGILLFNQAGRDRWVASQAQRIAAGSDVLDVGAGSCPYIEMFSHCRYTTHDFAQLEPEKIMGRRGYGRIDYVSDILAIPVPDASIDVVLCTEVLEHVPEPIRAVREMARVLRPGGTILLTAPLGAGLHQEPYHFYGGYTPHWYRKFLAEAGFEQVTVQANGGFFKHYGEESLRFALMLLPRRIPHLVFLPAWLLMLPWFAIVCPILGHVLDRLDVKKDFTVGFHVTALRAN